MWGKYPNDMHFFKIRSVFSVIDTDANSIVLYVFCFELHWRVAFLFQQSIWSCFQNRAQSAWGYQIKFIMHDSYWCGYSVSCPRSGVYFWTSRSTHKVTNGSPSLRGLLEEAALSCILVAPFDSIIFDFAVCIGRLWCDIQYTPRSCQTCSFSFQRKQYPKSSRHWELGKEMPGEEKKNKGPN